MGQYGGGGGRGGRGFRGGRGGGEFWREVGGQSRFRSNVTDFFLFSTAITLLSQDVAEEEVVQERTHMDPPVPGGRRERSSDHSLSSHGLLFRLSFLYRPVYSLLPFASLFYLLQGHSSKIDVVDVTTLLFLL